MKFCSAIFATFLALTQFAFAQEEGLSSYRLGAGDIISISVFDEKELSLEKVKLSEAGTISYPMLGEVRVNDLTVAELEQKITQSLKGTYLINPQVTVSIDQYRDVYVNGQVKKAGNYPFQPGLTVRKAVSMAGGFTDRANDSRVKIIHQGEDEKSEHKVELDAVVKPGDTITVDESFF